MLQVKFVHCPIIQLGNRTSVRPRSIFVQLLRNVAPVSRHGLADVETVFPLVEHGAFACFSTLPRVRLVHPKLGPNRSPAEHDDRLFERIRLHLVICALDGQCASATFSSRGTCSLESQDQESAPCTTKSTLRSTFGLTSNLQLALSLKIVFPMLWRSDLVFSALDVLFVFLFTRPSSSPRPPQKRYPLF